MALIKHFIEIKKYIPDIKTPLARGQRYIYPDIDNKYLYALVVNDNKKEITKAMLCSFVIYKGVDASFLFVSDSTHEINAFTPSTSVDTEQAMTSDGNVWKFDTDEMGLFLKARNKDGEHTIYFGDTYSDIAQVMDHIQEKKVVVTETIYV